MKKENKMTNKTEALEALNMIKYHHNQISEPVFKALIKTIRQALEETQEERYRRLHPPIVLEDREDVVCANNALTTEQSRVMELMAETLEFYSNQDNWMETETDESPMLLDDGCRAQITLSEYAKLEGQWKPLQPPKEENDDK